MSSSVDGLVTARGGARGGAGGLARGGAEGGAGGRSAALLPFEKNKVLKQVLSYCVFTDIVILLLSHYDIIITIIL